MENHLTVTVTLPGWHFITDDIHTLTKMDSSFLMAQNCLERVRTGNTDDMALRRWADNFRFI